MPILVGVPFRNLDQWRLFAGDMAEECTVDSPHIQIWLQARGLLPDQERRADKIAADSPVTH